MIEKSELPYFPYHRDPFESQSVRESNAKCDCCGEAKGIMYDGVMYSLDDPENICPWCIADGSAAEKYEGSFFDSYFVDENHKPVEVASKFYKEVYCKTIGFATYNPIGWWVHCGQPAEFVTRDEPYDMIFECKICGKRHVIEDID
tara:strand:- start:1294 stop:1731 length:438 start_codon:yes stop_codon:yes gene_type:complete